MDLQKDSEEEKRMVENALVVETIKARLGRSQASEERLFVENVRLEHALAEQKKDFEDIHEYLQTQLQEKTQKIEELESLNENLDLTLKQAIREHEEAIEKLTAENTTLRNELQKKMQEYNKKIKGTQDFLEQKERLEKELAELREKTDDALRQRDLKLAELERKHIQERELWKRETAQKVKDAKAQMMQLTENQLEMTTKRTIMENEQMASELGYQSRQTEKMLQRNELLSDANTRMKLQMVVAKETQDELAKRCLTYQQAMQKLLNKIQMDREIRKRNAEQLEVVNGELDEEKEKVTVLTMQLEEGSQRNGALEMELIQMREAREKELAAQDETTRFLKLCMADIKNKTVTLVDAYSSQRQPLVVPGRLEDLSLDQRSRALQYLLNKMQELPVAQS